MCFLIECSLNMRHLMDFCLSSKDLRWFYIPNIWYNFIYIFKYFLLQYTLHVCIKENDCWIFASEKKVNSFIFSRKLNSVSVEIYSYCAECGKGFTSFYSILFKWMDDNWIFKWKINLNNKAHFCGAEIKGYPIVISQCFSFFEWRKDIVKERITRIFEGKFFFCFLFFFRKKQLNKINK